MKGLILELIPHAPKMGLYVAPHIPEDKLRNALQDFAKTMHREEVVALYDATLLGSAKDGAVLAADRLIFQNNDLEPPQEVRYADLVEVDTERKLFRGQKVKVSVNRGRATITLLMDFSGKPEAASYVAGFLREAMLRGAAEEMDRPRASSVQTNVEAVREALTTLRDQGQLSEADFAQMMSVLE